MLTGRSTYISGNVIVFLLIAGVAIAEDKNEQLTIVEKEAQLSELQQREVYWTLDYELGSVDSEHLIQFSLRVENKTDRILHFDAFDSNCRCTVADKKVESIKPGKSGLFRISINPKSNGRSANHRVSFALFDSASTDRVEVTCSFELKGFLAFSQPQYRVEYREWDGAEDFDSIRLPFKFTAPVDFENLKLQGTGNFENVPLKIAASSEKAGEVIVDVGPQHLGEGSLFGTMQLTDTATGTSAFCQLTVAKRAEYEFAPSKIVMVWDGEAEEYRGNGVFRINVNPKGRMLTAKNPLAISLKTDSSCVLESKQLDKLGMIHRVTLKWASREVLADTTVNLTFVADGKQMFHKADLKFIR